MDITYKNHTICLYEEDGANNMRRIFACCKEDKTFPQVEIIMAKFLNPYSDEGWKRRDEFGLYGCLISSIKEHGPSERDAELFDSLLEQCEF